MKKLTSCVDCGKEVPEHEIVYCSDCGAPLCKDCGTLGLCSNCAEVWEAEKDLEAMEEGW